jgi:cell division protein FtsZ
LLELTDRRVSLSNAFRLADEVLHQGIQGISELITVPGLINLDFADVKTIMSEGGAALMAVGVGEGDDRARIAAEQAMNNRLLDISIDGARGILFNVTGGSNMSLYEVNQAASIIKEAAHPDVNLIFGAVINEEMGDQIRITVIATGFDPSVPVRKIVRPAVEQRVQPLQPQAARSENPPSTQERAEARRKSVDPFDLDLPTFLRKR